MASADAFQWLLVRSLVVLMAASELVFAQKGSLLVSVTDGAGMPLWNAEVIDRSKGKRLLTDARGLAAVPWNPENPLELRVRQIGYHFKDSVVVADAVRGSTVAIGLRRVVYELPAMAVALPDDCNFRADHASHELAADALEQLRLAAERYEYIRKRSPFKVFLERRTTTFDSMGVPVRIVENNEETRSDRWGEPYRRGRVVERVGIGFSVPILHLQSLADPRFWQTHCFAVTQWELLGEHKVLRLSFWPTRVVTTPDWSGWALLDSATSRLRRVEFRLVRLADSDRPYRLEGFTTFMMPAPFIVVPESTVAVWWRTKPSSLSAPPQMLQLIRVNAVEMKDSTRK